jgi:MFS family permease
MRAVIACRILQGLGDRGLDVLSKIILADMTTLQERSLYLGLLAIPIALGSIIGPTIGCVFSSLVSWRWMMDPSAPPWNFLFLVRVLSQTAVALKLTTVRAPTPSTTSKRGLHCRQWASHWDHSDLPPS